MRQITKRQLDRQGSKAKIAEWVPFQLVVDGEVVAAVIPTKARHIDSQPAKARHIDSQANKLRFSKASQASGRMRQS